MEAVQEAESDSEAEGDPSMDEPEEVKRRLCDGKKWTSFSIISFGAILIVLEIANVAVLNAWFRLFCPGIWMGVIFVFTGGAGLAFYRLEHLQHKRISMADAPPATTSYNKIFRIIYAILNALSLSLAVAMVVILGILIQALQDPNEMREAGSSMFAMATAQLVLYIFVIFASFFGFFYLIRHKQPEPKTVLKSEAALVNTSTISENPV